MKHIITMANPHFKMIRFIRLLFYHIYIYYYKVDKGNKVLAKFTTFLIFLLVFSIFIGSFYDLIIQKYDKYYTSISEKSYIYVCVISGLIIAYYLYKESFKDFYEYYDYNRKYYYYFFLIVLITLSLVIYTGNISREKIFKQREMESADWKYEIT